MAEYFHDAKRILAGRRAAAQTDFESNLASTYEKWPELFALDRKLNDLAAECALNALTPSANRDMIQQEYDTCKKDRAAWLHAHAMDEEYLRPKPFCEKCGDTGYVHATNELKNDADSSDGDEALEYCDCMRQLLIPANIQQSGILLYPHYRFSEADPDFFANKEDNATIFACCEAFSSLPEKCPNIYLYGAPGTGKTFIAISMAHEFLRQGKTAYIARSTDLVATMTAYRRMLSAFTVDADESRRITQKKKLLAEAEFLVIDDMGVETMSGYTQGDILDILETRSQRRLPTVITTNVDVGEALVKRYGSRVSSRIHRAFKKYHMTRTETKG
ncbi:MAG TPA: ATP-binding protein [Bacillota bacterium]|nr:ATP-binding protein [Bacillota bacterium]HPE39279.1 ATP-binding protein [Bacillota bacterium]